MQAQCKKVCNHKSCIDYIGKKGNEELRGLFLEGESFSSSTQSNFFINNKLHNGSSFDYKIEVQSIQDHQATIVIK